jgi:hypothetical protein
MIIELESFIICIQERNRVTCWSVERIIVESYVVFTDKLFCRFFSI